MPDDDSYPTHGWGALAADPWMSVGADGPEYRESLRRIWLRQGGSNEDFEARMPAKPASDGTTYLSISRRSPGFRKTCPIVRMPCFTCRKRSGATSTRAQKCTFGTCSPVTTNSGAFDISIPVL